MTQTIEYVVSLRGAKEATGDVEKIEHSFRRVDAAASKAGASMDRAAAPTRNLGRSALELSRAFEDAQYGISGLINNIPSLVMSLGAGAGVAGAISIAVVAAKQLYDRFGELGEAGKAGADVASEHMRALQKSIEDADKELQTLLIGATRARIANQRMAVEEAARAAKDAQQSFRASFGIDPNDAKQIDLIAAKAVGGLDLWATRWNAQKNEMEKIRVAADDVMAAYMKVTDAYNAAVEEQILLRKYEQIEAERIEQEKTDAVVDAANKQEEEYRRSHERRIKDAKAASEAEAKLRYEVFVAGLDDEEKALRAVRKMRAEERKREAKEMAAEFRAMDREREKIEKERDRRERRAMREREIAHKRTMQAIADAEKKTADYQASLVEGAVGQMTSTLSSYLDAKIKGEQDAEKKAVASFLSATGNQLIASGVRGVFEGAILASNPATAPSGAGMITTGLAAIAAGTAMAGGGAAVSSSIPSMTHHRVQSSGATRDPGASPRMHDTSSSSGGPMVINVTYGVAGPLPEDTARAIHRELRSGGRRTGR